MKFIDFIDFFEGPYCYMPRQFWKGFRYGLIAAIIGIILLTAGMTICFGAEALQIDLNLIIQMESSWDALAVSPAGAIGLCQIMPGKHGALAEWNQFHPGEQYTKADLYNPQVSMRIATWMLQVRIPQMLRAYQKPVTLENVLISYNAGIAYVKNGWKLRKETIEYIRKYKKGVV